MTTFDLVDQPWIPVVAGGGTIEVSLRDALIRAHEFDGLSVEEPLEAVALLRQVLLPVFIDATGFPSSDDDWADRWQRGRLEVPLIEEYLDQHRERFDLFHPSSPFGQVAQLRTGKDETKSVTLLLLAVATGNNVPLFSAYTEGSTAHLTAAEAARALLAVHCFDTAAIKSGAVGDPRVKDGKTTGNPTGPVGQFGVTIPIGRTLAATLLLNTPIRRHGPRQDDRPQWRRDSAGPAWVTRSPAGFLDLLTFQSRRVRLLPQAHQDGSITVSRVIVAAGDRMDFVPEDEPHTMWRQEDARSTGRPAAAKVAAARQSVRHEPGRAAWRGLTSMLTLRGPTVQGTSTTSLLDQIARLREEDVLPESLPLQVLTVGVVYGNKAAVIEDVVVDLMPLPVVALTAGQVREFLFELADQAERVRRAANDLGDDLRRAAGGDALPQKKHRLGDRLMHQLTPVARRVLTGLQNEPARVRDAQDAWRRTARRIALAAGDDLVDASPPTAFLRRSQEKREGRDLVVVVRSASTAHARYRSALAAIFPLMTGSDTDRPGDTDHEGDAA